MLFLYRLFIFTFLVFAFNLQAENTLIPEQQQNTVNAQVDNVGSISYEELSKLSQEIEELSANNSKLQEENIALKAALDIYELEEERKDFIANNVEALKQIIAINDISSIGFNNSNYEMALLAIRLNNIDVAKENLVAALQDLEVLINANKADLNNQVKSNTQSQNNSSSNNLLLENDDNKANIGSSDSTKSSIDINKLEEFNKSVSSSINLILGIINYIQTNNQEAIDNLKFAYQNSYNLYSAVYSLFYITKILDYLKDSNLCVSIDNLNTVLEKNNANILSKDDMNYLKNIKQEHCIN